MKTTFTLLIVLMSAFAANAQATYFGPAYAHACDASNTFSNVTDLDVSITGSATTSKLFFRHRYGMPDGSHNAYLNNSTGLYHYGSGWSIYDQTIATLAVENAFNVVKVIQNGTTFSHTVTVANSTLNYSYIDHPLLNNNPSAIFFVSKTWDNMVYETAHVGIWYSTSAGKWTVYNEDGTTALALNSTYNVLIPKSGTTRYTHSASLNSYITDLDHPLLNNNPNAVILIDHVWTGQYLNCELGVWYDGSKWTIYAEDFTPIEIGTPFNVLIVNTSPVTAVEEKVAQGQSFEIYPNPATDVIKLKLDETKRIEGIIITTIDGKKIMDISSAKVANNNPEINISSLPAGLYTLTIISENQTQTKRFSVIR